MQFAIQYTLKNPEDYLFNNKNPDDNVLQAAETGQLEEIVVTARQREERIEDVPVSITAFTAAESSAWNSVRKPQLVVMASAPRSLTHERSSANTSGSVWARSSCAGVATVTQSNWQSVHVRAGVHGVDVGRRGRVGAAAGGSGTENTGRCSQMRETADGHGRRRPGQRDQDARHGPAGDAPGVVMLEQQHRMHQQIMAFPSRAMYGERLRADYARFAVPHGAVWRALSGWTPETVQPAARLTTRPIEQIMCRVVDRDA
mgnify:CR=1 FL=1